MKASNRKVHLFFALVVGIIVTAGLVFAGIYFGHAITKATYKVVFFISDAVDVVVKTYLLTCF